MLLVRQKSVKLVGELYIVKKRSCFALTEGEDQSPKLSFDLTHACTLRHHAYFSF